MLSSYSVIVPVLNKHGEIIRTLQSVADSMVFFDDQYPGAERVRSEIIVVDEGSTDGTVDRVREFGRANPRLRLIQHHRSCGVGAARNTGVRMSHGEVLFFCDGDDLYLREHVLVGFSLLDRSASIGSPTPETFHLWVCGRGHVVFSADRPIAALRTGVRVKEPLLPYWKNAINNTIAQNLCVRRECHEWGEGFPEEFVYKRIHGCEDIAYESWLSTFFRVGHVEMETVEYVRYPGNSLDLQMNRFQHPRGSEYDSATPEQQSVHNIRKQREEQKIGYLLDKWIVLCPPPLPAALLNWVGIVRELLRRGRWTDAERVAGEAAHQGYTLPADLLEEIRTA